MKLHKYQIVAEDLTDGNWRWMTLLWLRPGPIADVSLKSLIHYSTEDICVKEANKFLTELGIEVEFKPSMNKNAKQRKAANPGAHQPRKSTKPKVGASAAEITRRISKERGS